MKEAYSERKEEGICMYYIRMGVGWENRDPCFSLHMCWLLKWVERIKLWVSILCKEVTFMSSLVSAWCYGNEMSDRVTNVWKNTSYKECFRDWFCDSKSLLFKCSSLFFGLWMCVLRHLTSLLSSSWMLMVMMTWTSNPPRSCLLIFPFV